MAKVKSALSSERYDNRILGKGQILSNDPRKTGLNMHQMILGTSGAGKTGSYLYANLCSMNSQSAVVVDSKGLLYGMFRDRLKARGYKVHQINMSDPSKSTIGYNPCDYLTDRKGNVSPKNILRFTQALLPETSDESEPVWIQGAQGIWAFITSYAMEALPEEDHNMETLLRLYHALVTKNGLNIFAQWCAEHPDSYTAGKYAELVGNSTAEKMFCSYLGFINNVCTTLAMPEVNAVYNSRRKLDLRSIGKTKQVVFFTAPDTDRALAPCCNLFYTQLIQQLIESADGNPDGRLKIPVMLYLDDFANTNLPDIDMTISVARSRDIGISIMLQSISQLESSYGKSRSDTILNNMDSIVYLGNNDKQTAAYIGTRVSKNETSVLCMPRNKEYILISGQQGFLADKIEPYTDYDMGSVPMSQSTAEGLSP